MAAEEELGAEVEFESSRVRFGGRHSTVVSVPIGVDYDRIQSFAADPALPQEQQRLRELLGLRADIIGLGVDRLDYTKGIPERLDALDALMTQRPELRGKLTFVQIGVPSRSDLESYAAIEAEIGQRIADLNARHRVPGGSPVVTYYTTALGAFSLVALYRLAHFCIVSSLHDGMNLVAKEFVAARDDERGVLVLSALAGAAQELERRGDHQSLRRRCLRRGAVAGDRHAGARADGAHAGDAEGRGRPERLQLGVRHPRGPREPLDQAAALLRARLGRDVGVSQGSEGLACGSVGDEVSLRSVGKTGIRSYGAGAPPTPRSGALSPYADGASRRPRPPGSVGKEAALRAVGRIGHAPTARQRRPRRRAAP